MVKAMLFWASALTLFNCQLALQTSSTLTYEAALPKYPVTDGYQFLDINSLTTLVDFCFSRSLKVAFQVYYTKYTDSPGKLLSV